MKAEEEGVRRWKRRGGCGRWRLRKVEEGRRMRRGEGEEEKEVEEEKLEMMLSKKTLREDN